MTRRDTLVDRCRHRQPTLAVLVEAAGLPVGHCVKSRHTCRLLVLAIDPAGRGCTLLWRMDGLPHDSIKLYPLSGAFSCDVLVVTMNAVLVVGRGTGNALAVNGFAGTTVGDKFPMQPSLLDTGVELDQVT